MTELTGREIDDILDDVLDDVTMQIKHCHCGGEATSIPLGPIDEEESSVGCSECGISGPVGETKEKAIIEWNKLMSLIEKGKKCII